MAWGRPLGIDDLVDRLARQDPSLKALILMPQRKLNGAQDVARLCQALQGHAHVTELSLSSHAIDAEGAAALASLLTSNHNIRCISIGNSQFGDQGMLALARGIGQSRSLTQLDAERKGLGASSMTDLAIALSSSSTLTSLNLSHNPLIGDQGITSLCSQPWTCIRQLDLLDCNIGVPALAALSICPGLAHLISLSCAMNPAISADAGATLCQLFAAAQQLRKLDLSHTCLADAGPASWLLAVQGGTAPATLTHLDLSHTGITAAGGQSLAEALAAPSCHVTHLVLEGNPALDNACVSALAGVLCSRHVQDPAAAPNMLSHLDLSRTGVSCAAMASLSTIPTLKTLSLLGCSLGSEASSQGLATAIAAFPVLEELVLSGCALDLSCLRAVLQALASGACPSLVSLEVGGNPGCSDDAFHAQVQELRAIRPELQVHWRSTDQHQQQGF